MALEFIEKNHQWMIATTPEITVAEFWLTDAPAGDGNRYALPSWMPEKVFITGAHLWREAIGDNENIIALIDHGRQIYNTGSAPLHQEGADWSKGESLVNLHSNLRENVRRFEHPKLLDRTTDSIWVQNDSSAGGLVVLNISYLVPAPDQPTDDGWPVEITYSEPVTAWQRTLTTNTGGNVASEWVTKHPLTAGGTQVRLTINAATNEALAIASLFVGLQATNYNMVAAVDAGVSTTVAANGTYQTGWIDLETSSSQTLLVKLGGSGGGRYVVGDGLWWRPTGGSYTYYSNSANITKVEVRSPT